MIVISSALVLSPPVTGINANNPLVGYHNLATIDNITADTEDVDYPASNLANVSTASRWVAGDGSEQYLTVVVDSIEELDYLAVARHNFGSTQVVLSVEGLSTELDDWEEIVQETLLPDDKPVLFRFEPRSYYAVRLRMQPSVAEPPMTAAVLYVGKLLIFERRICIGHTPIPYGRRTNITNGRSENGNFLGRIITGESRQTSLAVRNIRPQWYRQELDPFIVAAQEVPFFFAWRPGTYPMETGFAWLTSDAMPVNAMPNGMMSVDLEMGGVA